MASLARSPTIRWTSQAGLMMKILKQELIEHGLSRKALRRVGVHPRGLTDGGFNLTDQISY
ncbi:hypothetical protein SH449x_003801 [Pirellulaceae bacterium SH449]